MLIVNPRKLTSTKHYFKCTLEPKLYLNEAYIITNAILWGDSETLNIKLELPNPTNRPLPNTKKHQNLLKSTKI